MYPKQELQAFATAMACSEVEQKLGLCLQIPEQGQKTHKVGAAVSWNVEEDNRLRRQIAGAEFIKELKEAIAGQRQEAQYIVPGSINIFHDPHVYNCTKYGMYGWVEVY